MTERIFRLEWPEMLLIEKLLRDAAMPGGEMVMEMGGGVRFSIPSEEMLSLASRLRDAPQAVERTNEWASRALIVLNSVLDTIETTDPESETFLDSGADSLDCLFEVEGDIRTLVNRPSLAHPAEQEEDEVEAEKEESNV